MAEKPEASPDEIPAFRVSEKRVDDSWKEEVRREREAAAKALAAESRPAAPSPVPGAPGPAPAKPGAQGQKAPPPTAEQQQSRVFLSFVATLAQQALLQLGDIQNPVTGQHEVDLQGARYVIDVLGVIQAKTKGNLTAEEVEALSGTIGELKMRYVEVANEVQRQMQAQVQRSAPRGPLRPGPGGAIPGPSSGKRR